MKERNIIIVCCILLFLLIVAILYKNKIADFIHSKFPVKDAAKNDGVADSVSVVLDDATVLSKGDSNSFVELLQEMMNLILASQNKKASDYNISPTCIDSNGMLISDGDFGICTETLLYALTGKYSMSVKELNSMFPFISLEEWNENDTTDFWYSSTKEFTDALNNQLAYYEGF